MSTTLTSQPGEAEISDALGSQTTLDLDPGLSGDSYDSLIEEMLVGSPNTVARTEQIVKAVCAVAAGGAVMLVQ